MPRRHISTDSRNRLVIISGAGGNRRIFITGGTFGLDRRQRLTFTVRGPERWRRRIGTPTTIIFDGTWRLDKNRSLVYTLRQTKTQYNGDRLHLNAELMHSDDHSLVFGVAGQEDNGEYHVRLLKFQGDWKPAKDRRLGFFLQGTGQTQEKLYFSGRWQVRDNELVYTLRRTAAARGEAEHSLAFKGYWAMEDNRRLSYTLACGTRLCAFDVSFGHYRIRTDSAKLQFRVGAGVSAGRGGRRALTFTGQWRFQGRTAISFQRHASEGREPILRFGLGRFMRCGRRVSIELTTASGKPLGITVEFEQEFLERNARWLLKLSAESGRPVASTGIKVLW